MGLLSGVYACFKGMVKASYQFLVLFYKGVYGAVRYMVLFVYRPVLGKVFIVALFTGSATYAAIQAASNDPIASLEASIISIALLASVALFVLWRLVLQLITNEPEPEMAELSVTELE